MICEMLDNITNKITMRNCVCGNHTTLQLKLKKSHSSIIVLQLHPPKCNSYMTTLYIYDDLINKTSMLENKLVVW